MNKVVYIASMQRPWVCSPIRKKTQEKPNLPSKTHEQDRKRPELQDHDPKRTTTPRVAVIEIEMVKGFHLDQMRRS
jgi:hypothetical protein